MLRPTVAAASCVRAGRTSDLNIFAERLSVKSRLAAMLGEPVAQSARAGGGRQRGEENSVIIAAESGAEALGRRFASGRHNTQRPGPGFRQVAGLEDFDAPKASGTISMADGST